METKKLRIQGDKVDQVIYKIKRKYGSHNYNLTERIWVCYREDYSMRNNSNLVNSLIINQIDDRIVEIDIISGGGGEGLFSFGWGVEKSRTKSVMATIQEICNEYKQQLEII